jgi:hypothetical protein
MCVRYFPVHFKIIRIHENIGLDVYTDVVNKYDKKTEAQEQSPAELQMIQWFL